MSIFFPRDSNKIAGKSHTFSTQSDGILWGWSNNENGPHPSSFRPGTVTIDFRNARGLRSCPFGMYDLMRPIIIDLDYDEVRAPDVPRGFMDGDIVAREKRERSIKCFLKHIHPSRENLFLRSIFPVVFQVDTQLHFSLYSTHLRASSYRYHERVFIQF